jgi:MoxR-like ATPase
MATQNPIEYEGTFPLPEAQLDRFLLRISLGYPGFAEELSVIEQQEQTHPIDQLQAVASPEDIISLQNAAKSIYVDGAVREYIVGLIEATRSHEDVFWELRRGRHWACSGPSAPWRCYRTGTT